MTTSSESPSWLDGDKIDEVLFCEELRREHPMLCIHDVFFTVDGKVTGKKKGTCYIYAYAQNGVYVRVTVTVR